MYIIKRLAMKISAIGAHGVRFIEGIGAASFLLVRTISALPLTRRTFPIFLQQIYFIGVLSLLIVAVSGLFIGMVLALQSYLVLEMFASEDFVGAGVALVLLRELAPVVTALLFAGRAGSAVTSEIALMKTTEQLASLELMGINPLHRVLSPRFWAGVIAMPLLTLIFIVVSIWGSAFVTVDGFGVDGGMFWGTMRDAIVLHDVRTAVIKAFVFAFIVMWISIYEGYNAKPTAEGISYATTRTVVFGSLAILGLNFMLSAMLYL